MLFENYGHKFIDDNDRLIFVPTIDARKFGERLHKRILQHYWSPPNYFYHFSDGGHVAAAQAHLLSRFFVRLDLAKFFDSINRGRVHRSLRRIGVKHGFAWDAACQSTASRDGRRAPYSLRICQLFMGPKSDCHSNLPRSGSTIRRRRIDTK